MLNLSLTDETEHLKPCEVTEYTQANSSLLKTALSGHLEYMDSLGWLKVNEWANEEVINKTLEIASKIRQTAEVFVLIGVGGSNNAARAVLEALPEPKDSVEVLYAGNTLSPFALNKIIKKLEDKDVYIDCVAKNFETLEPGASFRVLRQYLVKRYGEQEANKRIICTGTPGSHLEDLCNKHGFTFLTFPENIGGRFTALSYVHLLPLAVAGIDIKAFVKGAADMEDELNAAKLENNTALRYAAIRNLLYQKGYKAEMLVSFEPQIAGFFRWWKQLFGESEGKLGKGLLPVSAEFSEDLHSLGQFIQEGSPVLFETFLDIKTQNSSLVLNADNIDDKFDYLNGKDFWNVNKASFEATRKAHSMTLPCLTLTVDRLDEYHLGQLFYFFEFACYLSACVLGVNPFDQAGVEAYKNLMFKTLGK